MTPLLRPEIDIHEGIALCATHHRAFDANILRYDDEYRIRITLPDRSGDGEAAMLLAFDGQELHLPNHEDLRPVSSGIAATPAPFADS